jgi:formylglycine-generating enzyme required for sulfatase activity
MKSVATTTIVSERRSGMRLVEVPAGSFAMGSPPAEAGRTAAERQHDVTIPRSFLLGEHEVTQQEWRAIMGADPSHFADCGPRCPVESVSFDDVRSFLAALNGASTNAKYTFRLPTEAEWEYACRAGTTTPFSTGATITTLQANFNGTAPYGAAPPGVFRERTTRATGFALNPWGMAEMHGNVAEWTADRLIAYGTTGAIADAGSQAFDLRVLRGGSWSSNASEVRCAARAGAAPDTRDRRIGFRVAADRVIP